MAFPWPGKKDSQDPLPKREFPAAFDLGGDSEESSRRDRDDTPPRRDRDDTPPQSSRSRPAPSKPAASSDVDEVQDLTERLAQLGKILDQTKDQVLGTVLQRQMQIAEVLAEKLDALADKMGRGGEGGGRGLDQKIDALYGKLDMLAAGSSRSAGGGEGGSPGISEAAMKAAVRPMSEKIDNLDGKLKTLNEKAAAAEAVKEAFVPTLTKIRDGLSEQHGALHGGITQLQQSLSVLPQYFEALRQQVVATQQRSDAGLRQIIEILRPTQPESPAGEVGGDWQQAVLGDDLACNQAIHAERQQLLTGVLRGDLAACSLVGQLMVFRASAAEKMPTLLKEIGEAYYRWHPRATSKPTDFEKALVEYLQRTCAQAGMANTIELVHPGERFDSGRHNASERGVEITQVLGWIVLRDNGKVYTKATVAVK